MGERMKLPERYKCRIRKPWYRVPSVYSTQIGLLKRCHDFPRLILNSLDAFTTDTAYRVKLSDQSSAAGDFVYSFVNSLTALTAELEGRHYGGGVLELVPSEIEKLYVPLVRVTKNELKELDLTVRAGGSDGIPQHQDKLIREKLGLAESEMDILHDAWRKLRNRRQRKS